MGSSAKLMIKFPYFGDLKKVLKNINDELFSDYPCPPKNDKSLLSFTADLKDLLDNFNNNSTEKGPSGFLADFLYKFKSNFLLSDGHGIKLNFSTSRKHLKDWSSE